MNRANLVIWLSLLFAQILTYLLARHWETLLHDDEPVTQPLLSLASLTNAGWSSLAGMETAATREGKTEEAETGLFKREALLLKLQDMEAALSLKGTEVQLVEDLKSWVALQENLRSGTEEGAFGLSFVEQVILWMGHIEELAGHCGVERIMLHPDARSAYPSLAFEITGRAGPIGEGLRALERGSPDWILQEIDLHRTDEEAEWWMRGSYCLDVEDAP